MVSTPRLRTILAFAISCLSFSHASAQSRSIGAQKVILDDGAGHTLVLQYQGPTSGTFTFPPGSNTTVQMGTVNGQTLRFDGSVWSPSSVLTNDGSNVSITGGLAIQNGLNVTGSLSLPANSITSAMIDQVNGADVLGNIPGNAANVTSTVNVAHGGTGLTSVAIGDLLIGSAGNTLVTLPTSASAGQILTSNGAGSAPSWQPAPLSTVIRNSTLVGDGSVGNPLGINLGNANTWTANQTFGGTFLITSNSRIAMTNSDNNARDIRLQEPSGTGSQYIGLRAPNVANNGNYVLPAVVGQVGSVMIVSQSNGIDSASMSWGSVGVSAGGTGLTSVGQGDLLVGAAGNTMSALPASSTAGQVLTSNGAGVAPSWQPAPTATVTRNSTLSGDGSVGNPLGINLGNSNTWTANQTFGGTFLITSNSRIAMTNSDNNARDIRLQEPSGTGTQYIGLRAPNVSNNGNYVLPAVVGSVGAVMTLSQSNGIDSASMSWTSYTVKTGSGSLDFPSTAASSCAELTIAFSGAAVGDVVQLGAPAGSVPAGAATYFAYVSAADTIKVRFCNLDTLNAVDPASGTFKVTLTHF